VCLTNCNYFHKNSPFPAARSSGGSPQWSDSFKGAPWGAWIVSNFISLILHDCSKGAALRKKMLEAHLFDMLLHPIIVTVYAVAPNVWFFRNELTTLREGTRTLATYTGHQFPQEVDRGDRLERGARSNRTASWIPTGISNKVRPCSWIAQLRCSPARNTDVTLSGRKGTPSQRWLSPASRTCEPHALSFSRVQIEQWINETAYIEINKAFLGIVQRGWKFACDLVSAYCKRTRVSHVHLRKASYIHLEFRVLHSIFLKIEEDF